MNPHYRSSQTGSGI